MYQKNKMKILCTDLDNTIIYSYKHDIGNEKMNVELYKEREISFITKRTFKKGKGGISYNTYIYKNHRAV